MADGTFETLFQTCVTAPGAAYVAARDSVIALGAAVRPVLDTKRSDPDWRVRLAADIVSGWQTQKDLFDRVITHVKLGEPDPTMGRPITGQLSSTRRARILAGYGAAVVPRLLEIVVKTKGVEPPIALDAVFLALVLLRDERALLPLIELTRSSADGGEQMLALSVLGALGNPQAREVARLLFADRGKGAAVRGAAAATLGMLGDTDSLDDVIAAARDARESATVREGAVLALGNLRDPRASAALAALLDSRPEESLTLAIVSSLGTAGDATAVAALEDIGRSHPEASVRRAAEETRNTRLA